MPELDYLLDDSLHIEPYPYAKSFEQAKHHPCLVIHTSGSTGMPKPVIWTHWMLATTDAQCLVSELDGRPTVWSILHGSSKRFYSGLPIFHGAGIVTPLIQVLFNSRTIVLGPPGLPTADSFKQVVDYGRIDAAVMLPVTLEDIASSSTALEKLARLRFVTYAGGKSV